MRRKNNLYEKMCERKNIEYAYDNVLKTLKNYKRKMYLLKNKVVLIPYIQKILIENKYVPREKEEFIVNERGKPRIVHSQKPIDKIINNCVAREILYKAIVPCLIDQNVASRPGLGTKMGREYAKKYINDSNREWKNFYILKGDIYKFFNSINHEILKRKLRKKIKEQRALNILYKIIDSDEKGLTLGSMTSQTLAIFYLNDLDHYIKEDLKIKRYIRYQDDFLIFVKTKKEAKDVLKKIRSFLEKDKLELNKSTRIYSSKESYIFLGKNVKGKNIRNKNAIYKTKKRIKEYERGQIEIGSLISIVNSYKYRIGNKVFLPLKRLDNKNE